MLLGFALVTLVSTEREQIGARATGTGLTNFLAFSNSMHTFITFWVMLEVSLGAVSRVRKFSAHTDAEDADDGPVEEPKDENWPSQGAVEINAATASYGQVLMIYPYFSLLPMRVLTVNLALELR